MATDQELDRLIAKTEELSKEAEDCQRIHEEYQRRREDSARQYGTSPEELAANCQRDIDHLRKHGTADVQQQLEELEAAFKAKQEEGLAEIKTDVEYQVQSIPGGKKHKRVHDLI